MRSELPTHPPEARPGALAGAPAGAHADAHAVLTLRRCARTLLAELPDLTEQLVARLLREQPAYQATAEADPRALRAEVRQSLEHSITSLLPSAASRARARGCTRAIGTARARQGFPLDAVLHAFRLGGALVWDRLLETVARRDPDDMRMFIPLAGEIWRFVDHHCKIIAEVYREVAREERWLRERRLRELVRGLLDGSTSLAALPRAAAELGLPEDGAYAVAVVSGPARSRVRARAAPAGMRLLWDEPRDAGRPDASAGRDAGGRAEAVLALLGDEPADALAAALRGPEGVPRGVRVGVSPTVSGLSAVGRARELAETALRTCPAGAVTLLDERLPAALLLADPELGAALDRRVLGPLAALEPAEREVLHRTLAAWVASDGSAQQAATRLYCHRNTVLNRLRRYEQLTGRSLHRMNDVVELSLALTARRLLPPA